MRRVGYHKLFLFVMSGIFYCLSFTTTLHAQQPIGGPYEPDSATVLLMHFDGNYENEVDATADAQPYGEVSFVEDDKTVDFSQQIRLNNESRLNRSHIQIPDTNSLDLTGSWTMEAWVKLDSFVDYEIDTYPYIMFKPGDPHTSRYYFSNYFINISERDREFATGYYSSDAESWIEIKSPEHLLQMGKWYHITSIRDTSRNIMVQMIHQNSNEPNRLPSEQQDSLELLYLKSFNYNKVGLQGDPNTSGQPLFIGTSPQNDTIPGLVNGFLDEIRISNTVREFQVPPLISGVTQLEKPSVDKDYQIKATIETLGKENIKSTTLHYRVNQGLWQSLNMVEKPGREYEATIPSQQIGSIVEYWVEAETEKGLKATDPREATALSRFYKFGVQADSTQVLDLSFNGLADGDIPIDSSLYENTVNYRGKGTPNYTRGNMYFNAADSTMLRINSPFLALSSFAFEVSFMFTDSVPSHQEPHILAKRNGAIWESNYRLYVRNQSPRPSIRIPNNICAGFLGKALHLKDISLTPDTWYTVGLALSSKEDTVFAWIKKTKADTLLSERGTCATETPMMGDGPLNIGAKNKDGPYFTGRIDEIELYNYTPDKKFFTSTGERNPSSLPQQVRLYQNYPNPFNPTTKIRFSLKRFSEVKLTVYDLLGRKIAILVDGNLSAGMHSVNFNASKLSSGVYLYRLKTNDYSQLRKMILLK